MKNFFIKLAVAVLPLCLSCQAQMPPEDGFGISVSVSVVSAEKAYVYTVPTDTEVEYCVFVVKESEYRESRIPTSAQYVKGEYEYEAGGLEKGTVYCAVALDELRGYRKVEKFDTDAVSGSSNPEGHPEDFNLGSVAVKQSRSAKRGIAGNLQTASDANLLAEGVSWDYNWSHEYPGVASDMYAAGMSFYPMVWNSGLNKDNISRLKKDYPQSGWILGYNEPNLTDQANMIPSVAAASWPDLREFANSLGMKLASPALNYGTLSGYSDPEKWLDDFIACDGIGPDAFDAVALHCYMPNVNGMRAMIRKFDKYAKPVYMTEFCHANGNITNDVSEQISFMSDVLNMLESDENVGGYSWFIARAGGSWSAISLLNNDYQNPALTDLGRLYVNFSSFDRNCWYGKGEAIPAEHYSAHNMCGVQTGWKEVFKVRPCTDSAGELMILCYQPDAWVEYQVEVPEDGTYALGARYVAELIGGKMTLTIDGADRRVVEFGKTSKWQCKWIEGLELKKGRHTIRLEHREGRVDFNWFFLD